MDMVAPMVLKDDDGASGDPPLSRLTRYHGILGLRECLEHRLGKSTPSDGSKERVRRDRMGYHSACTTQNGITLHTDLLAGLGMIASMWILGRLCQIPSKRARY